jgi:hypothetical protein
MIAGKPCWVLSLKSFLDKFVLCKSKPMSDKLKKYELDGKALFKSVASLWASVLLPLLIVFGITYLG